MEVITQILLIIFLVIVVRFIFILPEQINTISKRLKRIILLLEVSNPALNSDQLIEHSKHVDYWKQKYAKYRNDFSNKNKDVADLVSSIYFNTLRESELNQEIVARVSRGESLEKASEKYDKEFEELGDLNRKSEKKLRKLDKKIDDELTNRDLEYEFLGRWDREY